MHLNKNLVVEVESNVAMDVCVSEFYCKSCLKFRKILGAKTQKDSIGRYKKLCSACVSKIKAARK